MATIGQLRESERACLRISLTNLLAATDNLVRAAGWCAPDEHEQPMADAIRALDLASQHARQTLREAEHG